MELFNTLLIFFGGIGTGVALFLGLILWSALKGRNGVDRDGLCEREEDHDFIIKPAFGGTIGVCRNCGFTVLSEGLFDLQERDVKIINYMLGEQRARATIGKLEALKENI